MWRKLTKDKFVLGCVEGYKIPFLNKPKQNIVKFKSKSDSHEVKKAIDSFLEKGVIKRCKESRRQYVSPYFLTLKPDGTNRFILNLKRLNKFVQSFHFKYEDLKTATKLIGTGCYMITLDIKDAFLLVPVHKSSQKYLRFRFQEKCYQFQCLPFGLSTSPYVFTKILKPVLKYLRKRGFISSIYLDDILCIANSPDESLRNAQATSSLLKSLGFILNDKKSSSTPNTMCKFLGFLIDSRKSDLSLTNTKKEKLISLLETFLKKKSVSIIDLARIIGKLIAACPAVKYGWLYTKRLESEKIAALESSNGSYKGKTCITLEAKNDILWWIKNISTAKKSFKTLEFNIVINTGASDFGWAATDGTREICGCWNRSDIVYHINFKELLAVKLALVELGKNVRDCNILLRVDNTTAIAYINRMGGVKYKNYNDLARIIWQWAEVRNIWLRASYIASSDNNDADRLCTFSR